MHMVDSAALRGSKDLEAGASASRSAVISRAPVASRAVVTFRALEPADIPELMELQRALFPVQYQESFYNRLFMPGYYCLVGFTENGELVAVASARVMAMNTATETQQETEAYIMTLGVKETHRRQGLGEQAMLQILRLLRAQTRCEFASLHVKSTNEAALRFYAHMGFVSQPEVDFLRNHYFIHGQYWDAYRYTKTLRSPFMTMVRDLCPIL